MKLIVSACLLGIDCKYNGSNNISEALMNDIKGSTIIPVCPEQLGGLTTPRLPAEIIDGDGADVLNGKARVLKKNGDDATEEFIKGANETLKLAKLFGCEAAILKSRSPSCGCGKIYDGSFSGKQRDGNGVCAQLLSDNKILVYNEDNYKDMHF